MIQPANRSSLGAVLLVGAFLLTGCVVSETRPVVYVPAEQAQVDQPDARLVSVAVEVFDPGVTEEDEAKNEKRLIPVLKDVREAEARFIAVHLRDTLEKTGHWRSVRVVPAGHESLDVTVSGTILHSDGETLKLEIIARDSTGEVWMKEVYRSRTDSSGYADGQVYDRDPFQNTYNEIANDLLIALRAKSDEELARVQQVSELKFARDLAPESFGEHLKEDKSGQLEVARLPARDDPMMARVVKVREREYLFIDTLNEHYNAFYYQVDEPYESWRRFNYEEVVAVRELKTAARWRQIVGAAAVVGSVMMEQSTDNQTASVASDVLLVGGLEMFRQGWQIGKEAKMEADVLAELGSSFAAEVQPVNVQIAGETRRLQGSAATQFEEWRRLLREIYFSETGLGAEDVAIDTQVVTDSPAEAGDLPPGT